MKDSQAGSAMSRQGLLAAGCASQAVPDAPPPPLPHSQEPARRGLPGVRAAPDSKAPRGKVPQSAGKGSGWRAARLLRADLSRAHDGNKCACHQPTCSRQQKLLRI